MSYALRLEGVTKTYGLVKKFAALDGLSFSVPKGSICGLVGPNGAGKTTTFSVISGFLPPDAGTVDILGEGPFDPQRLKGRLGVLPQDADIGLRHTPREFLEHLGRLQGLSMQVAKAEAARLLQQLGLSDRADHRLSSLSHGMRRRVAVATALIGDPELVVLDEPTSGLDPKQVQVLRAFLAGQRGARTLLISSHNLAELELICDYVVFLNDGKCTREGPTAEITGRGQIVAWCLGPVALDLAPLMEALPEHGFYRDGEELVHEAPGAADLDAASLIIAGELVRQGVPIRGVRRGHSLERAFLSGEASA